MQCACAIFLYIACRIYNIFNYLIHGAIFEKEDCLSCNVCFDFVYNFCLKHFSF